MAEPPKVGRRVTGQIPITSPPLPSPSGSTSNAFVVPRPRAKVDPASVSHPSPPIRRQSSSTSTPTTTSTSRPSLRTTPSSVSLRSQTSSSSRARSPIPGGAHSSSSIPAASRPARKSSAPLPSASAHGQSASTEGGRKSPTKRAGSSPVVRVKASNIIGVTGSPQSTNTSTSTPPSARFRDRDGTQAGAPSSVDDHPRSSSVDKPARATPELPKLRARVNATPTTPISHSPLAGAQPRFQSLLTPTGVEQRQVAATSVITTPSPSDRDNQNHNHNNDHNPPNRSLTPHEPILLPSHLPLSLASPMLQSSSIQLMHPTASCPPSPIPSSFPQINTRPRAKRTLPYNPHTQTVPLPSTPLSPEMRTIELPAMTPTTTRTSDEYSRRSSISDGQRSQYSYNGSGGPGGAESVEARGGEIVGVGATSGDVKRDRLSGSTAVEGDLGVKGGVGEDEHRAPAEIAGPEDPADEEATADIRAAKTNRKIADLEISNASLLAINRSLEATKAKQRTEIIKLRRLLRESLSGTLLPPFSSDPSLNGSGNPPLPSALAFLNANEDESDPFDDEILDPQLEARWEKITNAVAAMKRRGEEAVQRGMEEVKLGGGRGRVLDWMEVEGLERRGQAQGLKMNEEMEEEEGEEGDRSVALTEAEVGTLQEEALQEERHAETT